MAYDEHLLNTLGAQHRHIRIYKWQTPGLTFRNRLSLPSDLKHLDHSIRITGGGIVFHAPNDLVFSITSWIDDPLFKQKLKEKMKIVSGWFQSSLTHLNIPITLSQSSKTHIQYCASYSNPYELTFNNQKCVAITLKRQAKKIIIQGICHLTSNRIHFDIGKHYAPYLTDGLQATKVQFNDLSKTLITEFKNLIE